MRVGENHKREENGAVDCGNGRAGGWQGEGMRLRFVKSFPVVL